MSRDSTRQLSPSFRVREFACKGSDVVLIDDELVVLLQNSIIAGALLGVVGGLIGVFVIARDMPFAVHGISELSFAGASAGLLFGIAETLVRHGINLHTAKIATLGERVEDVFFITDADNQPLADPELCARLQDAIVQQLSQANGENVSLGSISI
mgnify:CR=1 FL=1